MPGAAIWRSLADGRPDMISSTARIGLQYQREVALKFATLPPASTPAKLDDGSLE